MVRFIPSSFYSVIETDSLLLSPPCFLLFSTILLALIKGFPVTIQKYVQIYIYILLLLLLLFFRLDDMHASLPDLK